ncbi:uncharacterized protein TNCV_757481 [Trichonephila clavipes]|nr:uncharacterized protein TNCV_757481 [Trichonephila clavipes]
MDSLNSCPGGDLALPNLNVDKLSLNTRFLIISLPNSEMTKVSPFAIQKALIGIGGEPKSVKRLRSGDLLVETNSALQTKFFLLAKFFLNSPVTISPHKLLIPAVVSFLKLTYWAHLTGKSSRVFPVRVLFSPILPTNIKAGYLNCRIRPYIPNPLRCFKCRRFGHSQTSCRGQLTCSRCASVGHASTDCSLEPKCVNCLQPHPSNGK